MLACGEAGSPQAPPLGGYTCGVQITRVTRAAVECRKLPIHAIHLCHPTPHSLSCRVPPTTHPPRRTPRNRNCNRAPGFVTARHSVVMHCLRNAGGGRALAAGSAAASCTCRQQHVLARAAPSAPRQDARPHVSSSSSARSTTRCGASLSEKKCEPCEAAKDAMDRMGLAMVMDEATAETFRAQVRWLCGAMHVDAGAPARMRARAHCGTRPGRRQAPCAGDGC
jgi:hypothetical protein